MMKKQIIKILKYVFLILVAAFLVRYFYVNWDDYRNLSISVNWSILVAAVIFYFIYKISLASLWHYLTILAGVSISYKKAITAYLYSILGKYIPGKVFMLLARIPPYEEQGYPFSKLAVCFVEENLCTLLGAAFLFLISLFFFPNEIVAEYKWAAILMIAAFFVVLNPKMLNSFLKVLEKVTKKNNLTLDVTYVQMLKVVLLFVVNWIIVGIGFFLLARSIYPIPVSEFLYISGIFGLSCIIGILAIFSPSGIGVREGILLMGLMVVMPEEYAMIIALVSRLWMTVSELVLVGVAFIINQVNKYMLKRS